MTPLEYDLCPSTMIDEEIFDVEFEGIATNCISDPIPEIFSYKLTLDSITNENELYIKLKGDGEDLIDSSFVFLIECGNGDSQSEDIFMTKLLDFESLEDKGHILITNVEFNVIFNYTINGCFFNDIVQIGVIYER